MATNTLSPAQSSPFKAPPQWTMAFPLIVLGLWSCSALIPWSQSIAPQLSRRLLPPGPGHWLGTDHLGMDVGLLIAQGAGTSFIVSMSTVALCFVIGLPLGMIAGFVTGWPHRLLDRFMDMTLSFPPLILPMAMLAFLGKGTGTLILSLTVTGWVSYAKLMRSQYMVCSKLDYVKAATVIGASYWRIMIHHILRNTWSPLIVHMTFTIPGVILSETALNFLGLGVDRVSWGGLLNDGRGYLMDAPHMCFFPALCLFLVVTSLNFLGESLRIRLNKHRLH